MDEKLKLMCILAHPDDETLGTGNILAKYAAEGVQTYLICATRGEHGWPGDPQQYPGEQALGQIRENELRCAAEILGIHEVYFLGFIDGSLAEADHQDAVQRIVPYIRQVKPQVVVTFDPNGSYGHADHIAISQFTLAAIVAAASPGYQPYEDLPPHTVSKLYFLAETQKQVDLLQGVMGEDIVVKGEALQYIPWKEWAVTTRIDSAAYWEQIVRAVRCHASQDLKADGFEQVPQHYDRESWGYRCFYRAFSLVNGGREQETDLFAGLR